MNVDLKISPKNLLEWSNMEDWESGASAAPTNHTLSGAGASVAREPTTIKQGTYSAAVTRSGADTTLYHDYPDFADYAGRLVTYGCWVYASVASRARLSINDGVGASQSSYHSGVAGWEFLTVSRNIDSSATQIRCGMEINTGNTTAYFDGGILVEGPIVFYDTSTYFESIDFSRRYRNAKYTIPRQDGVLIPNVGFADKALSIKGHVWGTTQTNARTNFDSLLQYLNDGEKDIFLYDDRFVRGYLIGESHNYIAATRIVEFDLNFVVQNPFSLFVQKLRTVQAISSSPTSFTVTTNGNIYSKPKLSFIAGGSDITSITLENLTTGQTMSFTGTVDAGDTLIIDTSTGEVLNDSVDEIQYFVGDLTQFKLNPGANALKYTGSDGTVKVDWSDRWL